MSGVARRLLFVVRRWNGFIALFNQSFATFRSDEFLLDRTE